MGGDLDGWCFPSRAIGTRTLVLMGRTGNGKSATGNSILGKKEFKSKKSFSGVTSSSECHSTILTEGRVVNVIDTPGVFDFSVGKEVISKEILKCIDLAKDGIDAVLLVFAFGTRFTKEEAAAIQSLRTFFGPKIVVVFTGGDNLDEDDSLHEYLVNGPENLRDILKLCNNRVVVFDNKTEDEEKKTFQRQQLFALVDKMMEKNGGLPYSDILFAKIREAEMERQRHKNEVDSLQGRSEQVLTELMKNVQISYDVQLKRMLEMVESKLMETNQELQKRLAEEKTDRLNAEKFAKAAQEKSDADIKNLKKDLAEAKKSAEEFKQRQSKDGADIEKLKKDLVEAKKRAGEFEQRQSKDGADIEKLKMDLVEAKKKRAGEFEQTQPKEEAKSSGCHFVMNHHVKFFASLSL